jgi:hypothetical protein
MATENILPAALAPGALIDWDNYTGQPLKLIGVYPSQVGDEGKWLDLVVESYRPEGNGPRHIVSVPAGDPIPVA